MAREQRTVVEEELKSGRLPCVVATSSLELGIDMGAVDLVVQVEAPPTVASGLQRVGRAGHHVGAVSRGVINLTNELYAESSNTSFFRPEPRRSAQVALRLDF